MLIGIIGFIGSGKGTVGDYLHDEWGFEKDSFAKPLKDAVSIIFGWDRDMLEGDTDESRKWREQVDLYWSDVIGSQMTPRLALQLFGTECIRNIFHPNVWSASLINRVKVDTVVTDCRFTNEIQSIKESGGLVLRVKRGPEPKWYDEMIRFNSGVSFIEEDIDIQELRESGYIPHISETNWIGSEFDYIIENDGTLKELYEKIDKIMNEHG